MDNELKARLKREYKETLRPMGVYQFRNIINGKILVESSKNLPGSYNRLMFSLKHYCYKNQELQKDWEKFGENSFEFEILEELKTEGDTALDYSDDLEIMEELWLEKLQPYGDKGYNVK